MRTFSKSALLLLFTVLLSFAGIAAGVSEKVAHAPVVSVGEEKSESSFSQSGHVKFQLLHKSSEQVISPVNAQPAPNAGNYSLGFSNVLYALEHNMQQLATQYLLYSRGICLSLASKDIIFPFHHFW